MPASGGSEVIRPLVALLAAATLAGCILTPPTDDPDGPRLIVPPDFTGEQFIDVQGFSGPERRLELHVNGRPRTATTADDDGQFLFERVLLHPGLNIIRVILLPTEEELERLGAVVTEEHEYQPPAFAQVKVVYTRNPGP